MSFTLVKKQKCINSKKKKIIIFTITTSETVYQFLKITETIELVFLETDKIIKITSRTDAAVFYSKEIILKNV